MGAWGLDALRMAGERTGRQPAVGRRWAISTPSAWATTVGARVLDDGGNAVDAALAVSAALMVAVPHQTSPGGDAFWLVWPPGRAPLAYNASGRAGAAASAADLRRRGYARVPEREAHAVTVPGVVDGWHRIAERHASRPLPELVAPSVAAARSGLAATPYLVRQLTAADALLARRAESDRVFRPHGRTARVGEMVRLPDLATAIETAAADRDEFYAGAIAERVVDAVRSEGGSLAIDDMAGHAGSWGCSVSSRVPAALGPAGWCLDELGPNSQGWLALFTLGLADRLGGDRGRRSVTASVEAAKAAFVLRAAVLADPISMSTQIESWLEEARLDRIAAGLQLRRPALPEELARALDAPLMLDMPGAGDTVHFAIVDGHGLAVSCIQSIYFDFGTGIVPPGLGFALQNRGAGFSLRPGHANEIAPGRRPAHTLSPALARDSGGDLAAVLGAMGGDAQTQIHVQLLAALRADPDPARAAALPRWFVRPAGPRFEVLVERRGRLGAALERAGYRPTRVDPYDETMGHAQVILRMVDGTLVAAADPRSDGLALAS